MDGQPRRLDSWKEIAEYLGRDVRTAMRWAKSHQLPVRRIGGKGRSVFAFSHEIDAWLAGNRTDQDPAAAPAPEPLPPEHTAPNVASPHQSKGRLAAATIASAALVVLLIIMGFHEWTSRFGEGGAPLRIEANELAVALTDAAGRRREILRFDPDLQPVFTPTPPRIGDIDADGERDVLVGVSFYVDNRQRTPRTGELINLSTAGDVRWRFTFGDAPVFREERYDGPWGLTEWSVDPASPSTRIAVAAHHHTWWPSIAAVLDRSGKRQTTFTHPGWIESLMWLDGGRVALAGFSNARDAAAAAVIDAEGPDTQAPGTANTVFECVSCARATPLFYATFARSELNVVNGGRFNRAAVSRERGRIIVRTMEVEGDPVSATAIYEFDNDLRLLRARYDDLYWTVHANFERDGKIRHGRETCPERGGPPAVHVWDGANGWTRLRAEGDRAGASPGPR